MWQRSANSAIKRALKMLEAVPPMRGSEWAEQHFYLSAESSYVEQKWVNYPPQIFLLDIFCNDDIEEVYVPKAKRMGFTKMMLAASFYFSRHCRRNQAIWQPTDGDADEFTTTEFDSAIRDVKSMAEIFPALDKKHKHNTQSYKKFIGCATYIKGGTSAKNYRRISVDIAMQDELDAFDIDIDGEGSSPELAKGRIEGATFPKYIAGSTLKGKNTSILLGLMSQAESVFRYNVPCPHCGTLQPLEFGGKDKNYGLKWFNNDPETAAYLCNTCQCLFTQSDYLRVWQDGRWIDQWGNWYDQINGVFYDAHNVPMPKPPRKIGIDKYWSILSPQTTWAAIVEKWLAAAEKLKAGDKTLYKTFVNLTLGEAFEDEVEETNANELLERAEDYPLQIVPRGGLSLFAGVDVQGDRFEVSVWAAGVNEEMWIIDHIVIPANPALYDDFKKLDPVLLKVYPHAAGSALMIENVGIDTGGHWTHKVYAYVRARQHRDGWTGAPKHYPALHATKGMSNPGAPITCKPTLQDIEIDHKKIKNGVKLYGMGVNSLKDGLHDALQITHYGPGFVHLSKHLSEKWFKQLASEVRVSVKRQNKETTYWKVRSVGTRNEALDCLIICRYLMHKIGFNYKTAAEWRRIESIVQPAQADIFSFVPDAAPLPVEPVKTAISSKISLSGKLAR